jgi:B9 domain-containing protein 1
MYVEFIIFFIKTNLIHVCVLLSVLGPQIVFSLYSTNMWGTEVNCGYARIHVPCVISNDSNAQPVIIRTPIITPKSTNIWSSLINLIINRNPELRDPKILADGSKTKNLFTSSYGEVVVSLQCITKGTDKLNFDR